MSQGTVCPGCRLYIYPGQHVIGVEHEDPDQMLWHFMCHEPKPARPADGKELSLKPSLRGHRKEKTEPG